MVISNGFFSDGILTGLLSKAASLLKGAASAGSAHRIKLPRYLGQPFPFFYVQGRYHLDQSPGIGVFGVGKYLLHRGRFHYLPGIHHYDPLTVILDQA